MKRFVLLVAVLDSIFCGSRVSLREHTEKRPIPWDREEPSNYHHIRDSRIDEERELYSDPYYPHENMHSKPCTAEEAIRILKRHMRKEHALTKQHVFRDRCLSSHFNSRSIPPQERDSIHRKRHLRPYGPDDSTYSNENRIPRKIVCIPPLDEREKRRCNIPHRRNRHINYYPAYSKETNSREETDGIVYSLRGFLEKGQNRMKEAIDPSIDRARDIAQNTIDRILPDRTDRRNNRTDPSDNTPSNESDSTDSAPGNAPGNPVVPMYCSLSAGKIVPYIISYGPPDERKRRVYVNLSENEEDTYEKRENRNPLKSLRVRDTILSSPLTNRDVSGLISKIEKLSSFTKIVHISINDTPILRVDSDHLLHPMCTEGSLCLSESICVNTSPGRCTTKRACKAPTVNNFVRSIPKEQEDRSISLTVYNARTREFAIEKIFLHSEEDKHQKMLEYISIEAPLTETEAVCKKTVMAIRDAIISSRYGNRSDGRYNHTAYIVESNNARGFIIFLLIKQILEDERNERITTQMKQQIASIYLEIFKNEIGEDLIGTVSNKDISQVIDLLNHRRDGPIDSQHENYSGFRPGNNTHTHHSQWGDHTQHTSTYEREYGPNGNGYSTSTREGARYPGDTTY